MNALTVGSQLGALGRTGPSCKDFVRPPAAEPVTRDGGDSYQRGASYQGGDSCQGGASSHSPAEGPSWSLTPTSTSTTATKELDPPQSKKDSNFGEFHQSFGSDGFHQNLGLGGGLSVDLGSGNLSVDLGGGMRMGMNGTISFEF